MVIAGHVLNSSSLLFTEWGYIIVLVSSLIEALPALGSLFPGYTVVVISGFFAKLGALNLNYLIYLAAFGAIIGDNISYLLGRIYGYPFIIKYGEKLFLKMKYFAKARALFDNHSGKAIIIGRLNLVTRSFMPLIAGAAGVKYPKFIIFDVIAGLLWSALAVLVGYIFGESYQLAAGYIGKYLFLATVIGLAIAAAYYFLNKKKRAFLSKHFHYLLINIFSLYFFSKILEDVLSREPITKIDLWFNQWVVTLWQGRLNQLMIIASDLLTPLYVIILSLFLIGIFIYLKRWYFLALYSASLGGGLALSSLIKIIIGRPRPSGGLVAETGFSFPSQHAVTAVILFSLLFYSFKDDIKNKFLKYSFGAANVLLILLIGFSRIYLNVHWFSDVIAGFALGLFWLTLLILIFRLLDQLYEQKLNSIKQKLEAISFRNRI